MLSVFPLGALRGTESPKENDSDEASVFRLNGTDSPNLAVIVALPAGLSSKRETGASSSESGEPNIRVLLLIDACILLGTLIPCEEKALAVPASDKVTRDRPQTVG